MSNVSHIFEKHLDQTKQNLNTILKLQSEKLQLQSRVSQLEWALSVILESDPDVLEMNIHTIGNYLKGKK